MVDSLTRKRRDELFLLLGAAWLAGQGLLLWTAAVFAPLLLLSRSHPKPATPLFQKLVWIVLACGLTFLWAAVFNHLRVAFSALDRALVF